MSDSPRKSRASRPVTPPNRVVPPTEPSPEVALVAATFANRELRWARATSTHYASAHAEAARERDELAEALAAAECDAAVANAALEQRLADAYAANAALRREVSDTAEAGQAEANRLRDELRERDSEAEKLRQRIAELEAERAAIDAFFAERDAHIAERDRLAKQCEEEKARYARDTRELRLQLMAERVRVRAEEQRLRERHAQDVRNTAEELLTTKARVTEELNETLRQEKSLLSSDIQATREQSETLRQRNAKLQREAILAAEAETQYALRGAKQRKEIAALKEQVRITEENLNEVVEKYEKRLRKEAKEHNTALQQRTSERDDARSTAERLRRELMKLRTISKHIMKQRSELEEFFYDALAQVRREMLEERRNRNRTIGYHQGGNMYPKNIPQLKQDNELLLIGDGDDQHQAHPHHYQEQQKESKCRSLRPVPFHSLEEGFSWNNKEMSPGGDGNIRFSSLPLIPLSSGGVVPIMQKRLIPAKEWGYGESGALTIHTPPPPPLPVAGGELTLSHTEDLACIPSAPTLKDLQSVEIAQLSWKDKERVLQVLFKHLQGRSNAAKSKQCTPTDEADCLMDGVAVKPETNTFLTESA
ncbi:uncharacterized protein TM35_000342220 [Trypanosoma theileri]|uniref:Basal body-orientation factor 1 n=1 Tax=Trypanosoma theileri TaxID=67003 RepID=A0A1X0NN92_9TRYP|nr:uncharacterized protein TM35_000342220 [Trypanosoma theileri]ORC85610.1 hypothetical protein TM35_000342220 [Trypanosoma theileri]